MTTKRSTCTPRLSHTRRGITVQSVALEVGPSRSFRDDGASSVLFYLCVRGCYVTLSFYEENLSYTTNNNDNNNGVVAFAALSSYSSSSFTSSSSESESESESLLT